MKKLYPRLRIKQKYDIKISTASRKHTSQ